jgi:hypothetical protein
VLTLFDVKQGGPVTELARGGDHPGADEVLDRMAWLPRLLREIE